jgi:DNA sulfur modification protein DndD
MLRITRITLHNFGPFKGDQSIALHKRDGVTLVFGENMRGKTTLINAIRYAFFGKVLSRGAREMALHNIGNWEAASNGYHGFKVVLEFEHDGQNYTLTRECSKRGDVDEPTSDLDYTENHFLKRGSDVLGPSECESTLAKVMPEQVSRFFLFDGELLQQYEELLMNESDMGQEIKDAIERILGLPVLTNARFDMKQLKRDAEKKESRTAQKDQQTREYGTQNASLIEQRAGQEKELARLRTEMERLKGAKAENEEAMRANAKTKALLAEMDALQARVKELDNKIHERAERLSAMAKDAWRWVLRGDLEALQEKEQQVMTAIQTSAAKRQFASSQAEQIEQALLENKCQTCSQSIHGKTAKMLRSQLEELRATAIGEGQPSLEETFARINILRAIIANADGKAAMEEVLLAIDDAKIESARCQARIAEIQEAAKDLDESKLRRVAAAYDKTVQDIAIVEAGIKKEQDVLKEIDENIKRIQHEMERLGGADLRKDRECRELYESLGELFNQGVSVFRERLRRKVEADASNLFLKLTTEPDYAGLKINDNYGLIIVHKDQEEIAVRSAGAEHIVALSLMGALQRNAPLEGPIVMDSPFGRLDEGHTSRIVEALPRMAKQVILLVYESEMEPRFVRNTLKGNLLREYKIVRKSARHSVLEEKRG